MFSFFPTEHEFPTPTGTSSKLRVSAGPRCCPPSPARGWPWDCSLPCGSLSLKRAALPPGPGPWATQVSRPQAPVSCLLAHTWVPSAKITLLQLLRGRDRGPGLFPLHSPAHPPLPLGAGLQVSSFLPSPCPGLEETRLPELPLLAFILPASLVAKSCCCAGYSPQLRTGFS